MSEYKNIFSKTYSWKSTFLFTYFLSYLYIFLEWLFIVTKPSFLSLLTFFEKFQIFIFSGAVFTIICFVLLSLLLLISLFPFLSKYKNQFLVFSNLLPIAIATSLTILLIDNFTYTLFGVGISTNTGLFRITYTLLFILLFIYYFQKLNLHLSSLSAKLRNSQKTKKVLLILVSFLILSVGFQINNTRIIENTSFLETQETTGDYPNIILLTADALEAQYTSAYGYELDTTPRISELAEISLVAENSFTNTANTTGAVISIYNSKLASETRVIYPPDILKNEDSYQHLPGILSSYGYFTAQYTQPHFADAFTQNLLDGFSLANGVIKHQSSLFELINKYFDTNNSYFFYEIGNRIFDRLRHIFFIKDMTNNQNLVKGISIDYNDQEKINSVLNNLYDNEQPVFAHIHWMGTHGPNYWIQNQVFSAGTDPLDQENWDMSFYADSILEFDEGVGQILDYLKLNGLMDNTILIIGSDHGIKWTVENRLPLMIYFPDGEYTGSRESNIQHLDISPTILDYLKMIQPDWMNGESFLKNELANKPIFSFGVAGEHVEKDIFNTDYLHPLYFQFGHIGLINCDQWFKFYFNSLEMDYGEVVGHTKPCLPEDKLSVEKAFELMVNHLEENGFDTSELIDLNIND